DAEPPANRAVVEAGCDQLDDLQLARRERIQHRRFDRLRPLRRPRQEAVELADKFRPGGLGVDDPVIAACERREPGIGNERGERTSLLEGNARVSARMEHERRTFYPCGDLAEI